MNQVASNAPLFVLAGGPGRLKLPMVPLLAVPMFEVSTQTWMYAVPLLANQTMLQSIASHQSPGALPYLLTCVLPLLLAWAAVAFAACRMRSEQYVMGI